MNRERKTFREPAVVAMSFTFKTRRTFAAILLAMNTAHDDSSPRTAGGSSPDGRSLSTSPHRWPPGPPTPLTGWGLIVQMSRDLLGTLAQWQRSYGDVVHLRLWPEHEVVVCDPYLVRELLVKHRDAHIRWERSTRVFGHMLGHSVFVAEGDAWQRKRQALHPSFSAKAVQAFVKTIASATTQALSRWPSASGTGKTRPAHDWPIESEITSLTMDVILRLLFSSEVGDDARQAEHDVHACLAAANAEFYWPASWPDWMPWKREKRRALAALRRLIDHHIAQRLAQPARTWPDDLLTRLLHLHRADPAGWPLEAVHSECLTIFVAGHETTAATLTWWAWCMASNPGAQAAARAEVEQVLQGHAPEAEGIGSLRYLVQTIEETLRLHPAAPVLLTRRLVQPVDLGPWHLPARTMVLLPVQLMHHDSRWFPDPHTFRPERFGPDAPEIPRGAWMPFGAGPRVCLGQHLAMTEMTVIAAQLLQRFELSVPPGTNAPEPVLAVSLRPKEPLRLRVTRRDRIDGASR